MGVMNWTICSTHGLVLLALFAGAAAPAGTQAAPYLHAPSLYGFAKHDPAGLTILSNGRFLKPAGQAFPVARWPHGLAMSRDGELLFVASAGSGRIFKNWRSADSTSQEIKPPAKGPKKNRFNAGGADFSPDGHWLYWSGGEDGRVYLFDTAQGQLVTEIPLNVEIARQEYEDSFAVDLKMSKDGRYLFCADVTNFRVVVIDTEQRKVVGSVRVGRYPYALAVEGDRLYVANIGLFEYSPVPARTNAQFDARGLTIPPFGYPSSEARDGVDFEGRRIPGLGEPNVPESFSVWAVDIASPRQPKVINRWKTGLLVGAPSDNGKTVGGSAPNYLAISGESLFVSNGNNGMIQRTHCARSRTARRSGLSPARWSPVARCKSLGHGRCSGRQADLCRRTGD